jgi:hypothetical protein
MWNAWRDLVRWRPLANFKCCWRSLSNNRVVDFAFGWRLLAQRAGSRRARRNVPYGPEARRIGVADLPVAAPNCVAFYQSP